MSKDYRLGCYYGGGVGGGGGVGALNFIPKSGLEKENSLLGGGTLLSLLKISLKDSLY